MTVLNVVVLEQNIDSHTYKYNCGLVTVIINRTRDLYREILFLIGLFDSHNTYNYVHIYTKHVVD